MGTATTTACGSLTLFSEPARQWFASAFERPTPAQAQAWQAIGQGHHTLVVAPTGSGKTLAAFFWALDQLAQRPWRQAVKSAEPDTATASTRGIGSTGPTDTKVPAAGSKVLYVSPLKALAVDVERNLRSPLAGIRRIAAVLDLPEPKITIGIRTGDTTAADRRRLTSHPPDILITTPESLYLILTSAARESLRTVDTVIVDEVHAVSTTKRGAHLAVSLERLEHLIGKPVQRIGLSATVNPLEQAARFLGGVRPVTIVAPPADKQFQIDISVPVEDMTKPALSTPSSSRSQRIGPKPGLAGPGPGPGPGNAEPESGLVEEASGLVPDPRFTPPNDDLERTSIWPHVESEIAELIMRHRSTLVFANSRRLTEKLTARLNEIAAESSWGTPLASAPKTAAFPSAIAGASGLSDGAPPILARAHHGSVSKEQRAQIETDLKTGRLKAVVATSSLELGIDMGLVDLVIQVESPTSVASGLQRIGRAGHQVGQPSVGVIFPKHRADLLMTTVVAERMRQGQLERTTIPRNPLDVLAQQIVAAVSLDEWNTGELLRLIRKAAPFETLPDTAFQEVLDMLAGRYPAESFAELRPRLIWDRATDSLRAKPGAQRLAVTSGGTIPDRGLFPVFVIGDGGTRIGELDEEMVYESRVGDIFALGATSWRIAEITHDRVLVTPAAGQPGRLPFWHGDSVGRPAELGEAIGRFSRQISGLDDQHAMELLRGGLGLNQLAADNLIRYLRDQQASTGRLPDDKTIVVERFRDELGDWRLVIHSCFGARVHAPWALTIASAIQATTGSDAQVMHSDDGIILRLADTDDDATLRTATEALFMEPDRIDDAVTRLVGSSALFASRFRECAARALLLPRRDPGKRTPLWQQRQRGAALLTVAADFPSFPIMIETARECLRDVYDLPALKGLLAGIQKRRIEVVEVATTIPSPFARNLLFGYVAKYLYEGDSPLAERRAAALTLDSELLNELLGYTQLRELLDPDAVEQVERALMGLPGGREPQSVEDAADMLRLHVPRPRRDWRTRGIQDQWIDQLIGQRRAIELRVNGIEWVAAVEDASRLRDALGAALPVGLPEALLEPVSDPLADLIARFARTNGPFTVNAVAQNFGIGPAVAEASLERLRVRGLVASGELRPNSTGTQWCDTNVLSRLRRRSIAALRKEIEPVPASTLGLFLPEWQGLGSNWRGTDGTLRAIDLLAGAVVPLSALESLILPQRVVDYEPGMLDELGSTGEVIWRGHGRLAGGDGWIALYPTDLAAELAPDPTTALGGTLSPVGESVLAALAGGGAWLISELVARLPQLDPDAIYDEMWNLAWAGLITADTLAPLRAYLAIRGNLRKQSRQLPARTTGLGSRTRAARAARQLSLRGGHPALAGRWSIFPRTMPATPSPAPATVNTINTINTANGTTATPTPAPAPGADSTTRLAALAATLLERHGIVTRGTVTTENFPGGFSTAYRILAAMEDTGSARRGYVIEGLGAAQFALAGAVDRIREINREQEQARAFLAAGEPAYGPTIPASSAVSPSSPAANPAWVPRTAVLAAADPANPYGAALPWPEPDSFLPKPQSQKDALAMPSAQALAAITHSAVPPSANTPTTNALAAVELTGNASERPPNSTHRPSRKAGSVVVIVDGELTLYLEKGGKSLLTFATTATHPDPLDAAGQARRSPCGWWPHPGRLGAALREIAQASRKGWIGRLRIDRVNGVLAVDPPQAEQFSAAGFVLTPRGWRLKQ